MSDQDTYDLRLVHCPEPSCGYRVSHRSFVSFVDYDPVCPKCGGYHLSEFREEHLPPVRAELGGWLHA